MSNQDLVSIITPMFNAEQYVASAVESVMMQSWTDWELLIVDDCSTDGSWDLARSLEARDERIKVLKTEVNSGAAIARNLGIKEARGSYIAFLDSDDLWHKDKLKLQIPFMRDEDAAVSFTGYTMMTNNIPGEGKYISAKPSVNYRQLLRYNSIGCLTAVYDVSRLGKRYQQAVAYEDYVLWLNILKDGYIAKGLNVNLASYRLVKGSFSSNKFKVISFQWHIYRNIEKLGLLESIWYLSCYGFNGLRKHLTP